MAGNSKGWNDNRNQNQPRTKKSGSKKGLGKNGASFIQGWCVDFRNNAIIKLIASPKVAGTIDYTTKTGKTGQIWVASIDWGRGHKTTHTAFFDVQLNKLRIPDVNMVASISKNYFGTSIRKKYNK